MDVVLHVVVFVYFGIDSVITCCANSLNKSVFFFLPNNKMSAVSERHDVELLTGQDCQRRNESLLGIEGNILI